MREVHGNPGLWRLRLRMMLGFATLLVAVLVPSTASAAAASPAAISSAPRVTNASCTTGSTFWIECDAYWEGGTDPSTATWTAVSGSWINGSATDPVRRHTIGYGNCIPGSFYIVRVTITDAAGLSTSQLVPGGRRCAI